MARMEDFDVKIIEVHLVIPHNPTPRHTLPFTTFDLMQKRDPMPYLQRIAFYSGPQTTNEHLFSNMKNSLAQVLVRFYPFAGRLCLDAHGRPELDCTDDGVELSCAVADASLNDLDFSQYSPMFKKLIQRGNYEDITMSGTAPFLAVQVTKFRDGGISVAWSFDHLVVDGASIWHFMTSWAEFATGKPLSLLPSHDRCFERRNEDLISVANTGFKYTFRDLTSNITSRTFSLDEEEVEKMKLSVGNSFTTFESVAAHLWVALSKARQLGDSQVTQAQLPVNCRHRLVPPLPTGYFGNVVLPGVAESKVGELSKLAAACLLRNAIRSFGMADIKSQIHAYNGDQGTNPMCQRLEDGVDIFFGASLRHPVYDLDFGWGKPLAVRHARFLWDGFCFLDPSTKGGKNIEVTIHLPPDIMQTFNTMVKCFD